MSASRKLPPGRLIAATHNQGKVKELRDLLGDAGFTAISAGELGLPEAEETADTFRGNAELKALADLSSGGSDYSAVDVISYLLAGQRSSATNAPT